MLGLCAFLVCTAASSLTVIASQGNASREALQQSCELDYDSILPWTFSEPLADVFGRHIKTIGRGTSGSAQLYQRYDDGELVVVKVLDIPTLSTLNEVKCAWSPIHVQQIKLEYHIGRVLAHTPVLATTYGLLQDLTSCEWALVIEYIPSSLAQRYASLSDDELAEILFKLEEGVASMHRSGVSHGDIKLENVLLTANDTPVLIDLGSATFHSCPVEEPDAASNVRPGDFGTTAYLPPDVFTTLEYNRTASDLWAVGILSVLLFNARSPWQAATLADAGWRAFVGVEPAHMSTCLNILHILHQPTCTSGMAPLLASMPEMLQSAVARWLDLNPAMRGCSV